MTGPRSGSGQVFDEVVVILRRKKTRYGLKPKTYRLAFKPDPLSHVWVSATRPIKKKGKKLIPGDHTFHQIEFITKS